MVEGDPAGAAKMLQEAIKLSKDRAVFRGLGVLASFQQRASGGVWSLKRFRFPGPGSRRGPRVVADEWKSLRGCLSGYEVEFILPVLVSVDRPPFEYW